MGKSILIIKLGASGDVLRTTCILDGLHKIDPEIDKITWVTNEECVPILNHCTKPVSIVNKNHINGTLSKEFDYAVNFDEDLEACDFLNMAKAEIKFGYYNSGGHHCPINKKSNYAYQLSHDDNLKFKLNKKTYQQIIFEMCNIEWTGEFYDFNYPTTRGEYIALNTEVGDKWPTKKWENWEELKGNLKSHNLYFEEQRHFSKLEDYFEWIAKSRLVVTSDTFGMHIAIALRKPTLAIFGPTSHMEIEDYGYAEKIFDHTLDCLVCYKSECPTRHECMHTTGAHDLIGRIRNSIN